MLLVTTLITIKRTNNDELNLSFSRVKLAHWIISTRFTYCPELIRLYIYLNFTDYINDGTIWSLYLSCKLSTESISLTIVIVLYLPAKISTISNHCFSRNGDFSSKGRGFTYQGLAKIVSRQKGYFGLIETFWFNICHSKSLCFGCHIINASIWLLMKSVRYLSWFWGDFCRCFFWIQKSWAKILTSKW